MHESPMNPILHGQRSGARRNVQCEPLNPVYITNFMDIKQDVAMVDFHSLHSTTQALPRLLTLALHSRLSSEIHN